MKKVYYYYNKIKNSTFFISIYFKFTNEAEQYKKTGQLKNTATKSLKDFLENSSKETKYTKSYDP